MGQLLICFFINKPGENEMIELKGKKALRVLLLFVWGLVAVSCTQEVQNQVGRAVQNWTGTDGVLDIYAGEVLVKRFIKIDKLSTALGTGSTEARSYRYGYGYLDVNKNMMVDGGEKKVYFEFSDYSTSYVFYEHPGSNPDLLN
jgi:hypothetical protein